MPGGDWYLRIRWGATLSLIVWDACWHVRALVTWSRASQNPILCTATATRATLRHIRTIQHTPSCTSKSCSINIFTYSTASAGTAQLVVPWTGLGPRSTPDSSAARMTRALIADMPTMMPRAPSYLQHRSKPIVWIGKLHGWKQQTLAALGI
jgi:hypothetical protein